MSKLKEKLEAAIRQSPNVAKLKDQVQMTVTGEGLRIELLESAVSSFFETGNAQPTEAGQRDADVAGRLNSGSFPIVFRSKAIRTLHPYISSNGYSNWELSSDRANAARKLMQQSGVRANQVADVRGYADQRLRKPEDPTSATNRRVSIVVKYLAPGDPGMPVAAVPDAKPTTSAQVATAAAKPIAPAVPAGKNQR